MSGLLFVTFHSSHAIPVFPGAQGYGTETVAGRGGPVYKVTTLADSGPGSLREHVNRSGPRVIVFEVSGVINLSSPLQITNGYCTIAGQTAPPPGITLRNYALLVKASDVLIQHIASRPGNTITTAASQDALTVGTGSPVSATISGIVLDHVSCAWGTDETASVYSQAYPINDVTFSNCIFSEGIANGTYASGDPHNAFGPLIASLPGTLRVERVSFIRNILALNFYRNPVISHLVDDVQVVDNFIYRPGVEAKDAISINVIGNAIDSGTPPNPSMTVSVVGNVVMRHSATSWTSSYGAPDVISVSSVQRTLFDVNNSETTAFDFNVYVAGNSLYDPTSSGTWESPGNQYSSPFYQKTGSGTTPTELGSNPYMGSGVVSWGYATPPGSGDVTQLETVLKQRAGKFPAARDAYDVTLVTKIEQRTGSWNYDWEAVLDEYGSDPWSTVDVQNTRTLTLPTTNWTQDSDSDGYTDIEEWLHGWSAVVEGTLVGYWQLDEGTGTTAADSSDFGNDGTLSGGPAWTAGAINGGLDFDGTDDRVTAGSDVSLDNLPALTVAAWIKPASMGEGGKGRIVDKSSGTSPVDGWCFHVDGNNQIAFRVDYPTQLNRVSATNSVDSDEWNHVAVTWDGGAAYGGIHIYVNGTEVGYASGADGAGTREDDAASSLSLGNDSTGARTFDGILDDVLVYSRALDASEVLALYEATSTSLVGYWQLDDGSGTTAADSSDFGNDGTLVNGPVWVSGVINGGLSFDGIDDRVDAGSDVSLDNLPAISVSAWIKPDTMGENGKGRIVDKSSGISPVNGWCLHVDGDDQLAFRVDYSPQLNRVSATDAITTGVWNHVAATWDGGASYTGVRIYVNGAEVGYASGADATDSRADDATSSLSLGNDSTGARTFDGTLDDILVYNRVLDSGEVSALYQLGLPGPTGLTVTAVGFDQIDLSWGDNSASETGFLIERKTGSGGAYAQIDTVVANTTSYSDTSAGAGTEYYYRVRAFNAGGESINSNEASDTTDEITSGRQGQWKLDSNANDSSGNGNNGSLTGGPSYATGQIGSGLDFDGSDDRLNAGSGSTLDDLVTQGGGGMTITAWIRADSMGETGKGRIVDKSTGTTPVGGWIFFVTGTNQLSFMADFSETSNLDRISTADAIATGEWRHVVVTWTGSGTDTSALLYVNDAPVSGYATSNSGGGARASDADADLSIGNNNGTTRTFDGVIDDVRVYNRVLSAAERTAIYRAGQ